MSDTHDPHKAAPPSEDGYVAPERSSGGRLNPKSVLIGAGCVAAVGALVYFAAGMQIQREKEEPKGIEPAQITARAPEYQPPPPEEEKKVEEPKKEPRRERERRQEEPRKEAKKEDDNKEFKVSTLAFQNKYMENVIAPLLNGSGMSAGGGAPGGGGGVRQAMASGTGAGGDDDEGGGRGGGGQGSRAAKNSFYTGGGGRSGQGLYHPHSLQPELEGCVVKAGDEIIVENPSKVRTELPGQVRGYVIEDVIGRIYHGNDEVEECTAIPAGSRVMSEVNASAVGRGDMRVQMCATRIDMPGGGIMPMECSPALGQDGSFGVEAESDYAWGGIATGILIEGALSFVGALGSLIEGPAGVAVNVGTQGIRGVGSNYVDQELMRPPVLTMQPNAIYRIQINSDIAFPTQE